MAERCPRSPSRRTVLALGCSGLTALLAGCNEGSTEQTTTDTTTETATSTRTETTSTTSLRAAANQFVDRFTDEEFAAAVDLFSERYLSRFASTVPAQFPNTFDSPELALQRYWELLTSQHGAFETVSGLTVEEDSGGGTTTATLECALDTQQLLLQFDADRVITDLQFPAEYSPPNYVDPDRFEERTVSIQSDSPELEGTLTLPVGPNEEVPCVVLVHGAGPYDRDYTVGPNKFFRDIARGLASRGIAAYRYDKRTFAIDLPPEEQDIDTVAVNDAVAAAERVVEVAPVSDDRVFVAGHSLGGIVAPRIAARHSELAGIALLDAPALSVTEAGSLGAEAIRTAEWPTEREREMIVQLFETRAELSAESINESATIARRPGALWKSLLSYDQVATAAGLSIPMFVAQAGREFTASEPNLSQLSYDRWRDALPSDTTRFTFYETLNHYLQSGAPPYIPSEIVAFHDNVAMTLVSDLESWVDSQ